MQDPSRAGSPAVWRTRKSSMPSVTVRFGNRSMEGRHGSGARPSTGAASQTVAVTASPTDAGTVIGVGLADPWSTVWVDNNGTLTTSVLPINTGATGVAAASPDGSIYLPAGPWFRMSRDNGKSWLPLVGSPSTYGTGLNVQRLSVCSSIPSVVYLRRPPRFLPEPGCGILLDESELSERFHGGGGSVQLPDSLRDRPGRSGAFRMAARHGRRSTEI